jgi:serine phosphatase RsbU (regulator of sigma subunit)
VHGDEFGDARIEASARARLAEPPQRMAEGLAADARAFRGGEAPEDDVSVAVVRRAV